MDRLPTNDKLDELGQEIRRLQIEVRQNQEIVQKRLDNLSNVIGNSISTTSCEQINSKDWDKKLGKNEKRSRRKLNLFTSSPKQISTTDIDNQLGSVYGCYELRDSVKEALRSMASTDSALVAVRSNVKSDFIVAEIDHMVRTISMMRKVFIRLMDRMEIPDVEDGDAGSQILP